MKNNKLLNMSPEEISKWAKESVDDYIKKEKEREQQLLEFKKIRENEVMEEVYNYLLNDEYKYIDEDDILYSPKDYNFTSDEFNMIFNSLMAYAKNNKLEGSEEDNHFENYNYYLKYKDMNILLRIMFGQGTCTQMRIDLPCYWNEDKIFTWEDYKSNNNLYTDERKKKELLDKFSEFLDKMEEETKLDYDMTIDELSVNIESRMGGF